MRPEVPLALGAVLVVVLALAVPVTFPGVLAEADPGPVRQGHLQIGEVTVHTQDIGGMTATIGVQSALVKRGGPIENASIILRATDMESGLVARTATVPVGTIKGTQEVRVDGSLRLEREGGYRIEALLYVDGERADAAGKTVQGFDGLQPDYARAPVTFRQFESELPTIEYAIAEVAESNVDLNLTTYLINRGDSPADEYRLTLKARQSASNIVADQRTVAVRGIGSGATVPATATLTVPAEYNYYLDAVLWRDGVIVGTERSVANLRPNRTLEVEPTQQPGGLEVSDFAPEDGDGRNGDAGPTRTAGGGGSMPGFGSIIGLVAIAIAAGIILRSNNE